MPVFENIELLQGERRKISKKMEGKCWMKYGKRPKGGRR